MRTWMVTGLIVVLAGAGTFAQDKAPAAAAPAPDVAALKQQRTELEKQRTDLQGKLTERVAVLSKTDAVVKAQAAAAEADAKLDKFLQTDPKLGDLRKGQQTANAALQAAIEKATAEDKEGAANRETRAGIVGAAYQKDYEIGLLDFEYDRKVKRLVGEDPAVSGARQAVWAAEQALRETDGGDSELQTLRQKADQARRRLTRAQEDATTEAYVQARKAMQEAAKAQTEAVAGLASRKALEEAKAAADAVQGSKVAGDEEAKSLRAEQAKLLKERAELDYQLAMVDHKLQNGVNRRVSRDPEVLKAGAAYAMADAAFRQEMESDPKVAAARKAYQEAQKALQAQEQAVRTAQAVADAAKTLEAAEAALDAARKVKLQKAQEQVSDARKKEAEVFGAKLAGDAGGKVVSEKRAGIATSREADQKRIQELDAAYGKVRERVSKEHPDVAKARQSVTEANAAYEKGVKESEAPALEKARQEARNAARKALEDAVAADEACKALRPQIDAVVAKIRDMDREIRKAEAPPPKPATPPAAVPAKAPDAKK